MRLTTRAGLISHQRISVVVQNAAVAAEAVNFGLVPELRQALVVHQPCVDGGHVLEPEPAPPHPERPRQLRARDGELDARPADSRWLSIS